MRRKALAQAAAAARTAVTSARAVLDGSAPPIDVPRRAPPPTGRLDLGRVRGTADARRPAPSINSVSIGHDGAGDATSCLLSISFDSRSFEQTNQMRVFRADRGPSKEPLLASVDALVELSTGNGRKETDRIRKTAELLSSAGTQTHLSSTVGVDEFQNVFVVTGASSVLNVRAPYRSSNRTMGAARLLDSSVLDDIVAENPGFYAARRSVAGIELPTRQPQSLPIGNTFGAEIIGGVAVDDANAAGFKEIGLTAVAALSPRSIGTTIVAVSFVDRTATFGRTYSYYVTSIDRSGIESQRSRIVTVESVPTSSVEKPTVTYVMSAGAVKFSMAARGAQKFEVYRLGGIRFDDDVITIGPHGSVVSTVPLQRSLTEFVRIADVKASSDGSAAFCDSTISPGTMVKYRVYSIDPFGRKQQTPFVCEISIPDISIRPLLMRPSINAEQTTSGREIRVDVRCDDDRVIAIIVGRRAVDLGEQRYGHPAEPDIQNLGVKDQKRNAFKLGPMLNSVGSWTGTYTNVSGGITFTDTDVQLDRIYRYSAFGIDRRGNRTSSVFSRLVGVYIHPVSSAPAAFSGSYDARGITLSWLPASTEISAIDMIGDQDILAASSVKTAYQIERRSIGGQWEVMPPTTGTVFLDPFIANVVPTARPSFPALNSSYEYRVSSLMAQGIISMTTAPVRIDTTEEVKAPLVSATCPNVSQLPLVNKLSWTYSGAIVGSWEVERSVVNRYAASRLGVKDISDLTFELVGTVTKESSRGLAFTVDSRVTTDKSERSFFDRDVDPSNAYFYRVRAVSVNGAKSPWGSASVTINDGGAGRRLTAAISAGDVNRMKRSTRSVVTPKPRPRR